MSRVASIYSVKEAAKLAGLSVSMLDYLCRSDVIIPSASKKRGRGTARIFSFGDVVILRALSRFLRAGISVLHLRKALKGLRKRHPEITPTSLPGAFLVTDGRTIFLRQGREVVEDLIPGQLAFAFVLELRTIRHEVLNEHALHSQKRERPRRQA